MTKIIYEAIIGLCAGIVLYYIFTRLFPKKKSSKPAPKELEEEQEFTLDKDNLASSVTTVRPDYPPMSVVAGDTIAGVIPTTSSKYERLLNPSCEHQWNKIFSTDVEHTINASSTYYRCSKCGKIKTE